MERVKIKFPEQKPIFIIDIPVRIGDVNYGNHVGHDSIVSILHDARMLWLAKNGGSEMDAGGTSLIMADLMVAYKGESFYGDTLKIEIFGTDITDCSFSLLYRVSCLEMPIAHAKTGMLCFDYEVRKIATLTDRLKEYLT